jgi:hypothetical protein
MKKAILRHAAPQERRVLRRKETIGDIYGK